MGSIHTAASIIPESVGVFPCTITYLPIPQTYLPISPMVGTGLAESSAVIDSMAICGLDPSAGRGGTRMGQAQAPPCVWLQLQHFTAGLFVFLSVKSHLLPILKTFLLILTGFIS